MSQKEQSFTMKPTLTLLTALQATLHATDAPAKRPLLLANYYCWYHDGQHPKRPFLHWTYPSSETNALAKKAQKPGEPPPNSVFRPLAGLCDSDDPKVAEWHLHLAKALRIDAFLVDWCDTHNQLDQKLPLNVSPRSVVVVVRPLTTVFLCHPPSHLLPLLTGPSHHWAILLPLSKNRSSGTRPKCGDFFARAMRTSPMRSVRHGR